MDGDGDVVRLDCEEKTEACANILNQFAAAVGIKEGVALMDGIESAIANKDQFSVTVINDPYDGKDQYRLSKFNAVKTVVEAEDDLPE